MELKRAQVEHWELIVVCLFARLWGFVLLLFKFYMGYKEGIVEKFIGSQVCLLQTTF